MAACAAWEERDLMMTRRFVMPDRFGVNGRFCLLGGWCDLVRFQLILGCHWALFLTLIRVVYMYCLMLILQRGMTWLFVSYRCKSSSLSWTCPPQSFGNLTAPVPSPSFTICILTSMHQVVGSFDPLSPWSSCLRPDDTVSWTGTWTPTENSLVLRAMIPSQCYVSLAILRAMSVTIVPNESDFP